MNKKILRQTLLGFTVPPLGWVFLITYVNIVNYQELIMILKQPIFLLYVISFIIFMIYFVNNEIKKIENYIQDGHGSETEVCNKVSMLPKKFLILEVLYCTLGPLVAFLPLLKNGIQFKSVLFAELLGIPFTALFTLPYFFSFLTEVESISCHVGNLDMTKKAISTRARLFIGTSFLAIGLITLFMISNIALVFMRDNPIDVIINKNIVLGIVALITCLMNVYVVSKQLLDPINEIRKTISKLDEISGGVGDLTLQIQPKTKEQIGEIAIIINQLINQFRSLVTSVSVNTQHIDESIVNTNEMTNEIHGILEHHSDAINEMTKTTREMAESIINVTEKTRFLYEEIEEISKKADQVNTSGINSLEHLQNGKKNFSKIEDEMDVVVSSMANIGDSIGNVKTLTDEMKTIIDVIDAIAKQTTLLSLNASIEAARAGEHGKGFEIVAKEVGNLATESCEATVSITNLINNIKDVVFTAVSEIDKNMLLVRDKVEDLKDSKESFDSITTSVEHTISLVNGINQNVSKAYANAEEILEISEFQAASSEEIHASTIEVENMSKGISDKSKCVLSNVRKLEKMSLSSKELVKNLKVN